MIPNPKKTLTINVPTDKVVEAIDNLSETLKKVNLSGYNLESKNELFNSWTYTKTEALSLGSKIYLDAQPLNDNQTQINIEVSRVLGSFDQGYEVTNAMNHITNVINGITWYLNPQESQKVMTQAHSQNGSTNTLMVIVYVIGGLWILGMLL
jgi:hypothetical protein